MAGGNVLRIANAMEKHLHQIQAVIFDLDGVITDTSTLHTRAWKRMADEEGIPFDPQTADELRGVSRQKSLEILLYKARTLHGFKKNYTPAEFEELMNRKNSYYVESLSSITEKDLLAGVKEIFEFLKANGYKIAIASSSKNAREVIKNLQIEGIPDAIVDGTEIEHSKPHPEIFQKAANRLGVAYEQCAVVEDAASGVEAANAAGMMSIGIGPEERFLAGNAIPDYRFEDMEALSRGINRLFQSAE